VGGAEGITEVKVFGLDKAVNKVEIETGIAC
jgi:hypothetical protein